jgi:hypothetical protein
MQLAEWVEENTAKRNQVAAVVLAVVEMDGQGDEQLFPHLCRPGVE